MDENHKNPVIISIAVIVVVGLAIAGVVLLNRNEDDTDEAAGKSNEVTNTTSPSTESQTTEVASSGQYKSGTYTAKGSYVSPGGVEHVTVTVTLDGNTITDAKVSPQPASPTSTEYQGKFVGGFKALVVGKNIDDVKLSKVSGSSLTSGGFNEALQDIKEQARA